MLPLSLEKQVFTALACDPLSDIRIVLLETVLKFGNKTVTLDKCFVYNQQKLIALFVTSGNSAEFVVFWVPYNPAHVYELKYQTIFTENFNLNLLDASYTFFIY